MDLDDVFVYFELMVRGWMQERLILIEPLCHFLATQR
jgi:hypothetical protein